MKDQKVKTMHLDKPVVQRVFRFYKFLSKRSNVPVTELASHEKLVLTTHDCTNSRKIHRMLQPVISEFPLLRKKILSYL